MVEQQTKQTTTKRKPSRQMNTGPSPDVVRLGSGTEGCDSRSATWCRVSDVRQVWPLLCKPTDTTPYPETTSGRTLSLHQSSRPRWKF